MSFWMASSIYIMTGATSNRVWPLLIGLPSIRFRSPVRTMPLTGPCKGQGLELFHAPFELKAGLSAAHPAGLSGLLRYHLRPWVVAHFRGLVFFRSRLASCSSISRPSSCPGYALFGRGHQRRTMASLSRIPSKRAAVADGTFGLYQGFGADAERDQFRYPTRTMATAQSETLPAMKFPVVRTLP